MLAVRRTESPPSSKEGTRTPHYGKIPREIGLMPVGGLVLLSDPSFFFSYFCRYGSALAFKIFFGNIVRDGIEDRARRRWATDGVIEADVRAGACVVDLRWGGRVWVERERKIEGSCVWV